MYADELSTYPLVILPGYICVNLHPSAVGLFFGSLRVPSCAFAVVVSRVWLRLRRAVQGAESHREWTRIDAKANRTKQNRRLTQMYADKHSTYPLVVLLRYICVYVRSSVVGRFSSAPFASLCVHSRLSCLVFGCVSAASGNLRISYSGVLICGLVLG
jgi:hypothetical protein